MDVNLGNGYKLLHMRIQQHRLVGTPICGVYCNKATYNRAIEDVK